MSTIEIYFLDDSELAEVESVSKGYRVDVYVKISNLFYNIRVFDIFTLKQAFERELDGYGYYAIEPNLVLVKDANKEEIVFTINKLNEQKYFEDLKPLETIDIRQLKRIQ